MEFIKIDNYTYRITEENEYIGNISFFVENDICIINHLKIFERKKGFGKKAIEQLIEENYRLYKVLSVEESIGFWIKQGFNTTGKTKGHVIELIR